MFVEQPQSVVRVEADHPDAVEKGSGVLIRSNQVLTAHHVIRNAKTRSTIKIIFKNGTEREAKVLKSSKLWDIVLLEFEPVLIPPASLAKRPAVKGEKVVICGFPGGKDYAERGGRVSGFRHPDKNAEPHLFEANVECESGMSGGPAFNERGEIVGTLFGTLRYANCTGLQPIMELLNEQPKYQLSAPVSGGSLGDRTPDSKLRRPGNPLSVDRQRGQ